MARRRIDTPEGDPDPGIGGQDPSPPPAPTEADSPAAGQFPPGFGPGWVKLRGGRGWRDPEGLIWKIDRLHRDQGKRP